MADDLSFSIGNGDDSQRRAFRAKIPGLSVHLAKNDVVYKVADLSAMGLAFFDDEGVFKEGEPVTFDMLLNNKVFLSELKAKVMRVLKNGLVGCDFEINDHRKEARLDKLVLEVQKRLIAMSKKAKK